MIDYFKGVFARLIGREDNITKINRRQNDIEFVNQRAQELTAMYAVDIDRAVDTEIGVIESCTVAALGRIHRLANSGAVKPKVNEALSVAQKEIEAALDKLETVIEEAY